MGVRSEKAEARGPLVGLKILELGHFIAAPFCARLLADLGADIIKVEPPGGDPVRKWGMQADGNTAWWSMHGRNKYSIVLDLKKREATEIVLGLAAKCHAAVENFRPGQLAKLGLGDDALHAANPKLIIAHISGYGQEGPYRDRAAFGVIGEAIGGLRYLTNHPKGQSNSPPVRVGVSIGDSVAGLYAAFGIMSALWDQKSSTFKSGQVLDVALTDSVLSMMDGILPEYGAFGAVREPVGSRIANAAPSNAYPTHDGKWLVIAANSDPLFSRLCRLLGMPELPSDPRFVGNAARCDNADELDRIIGEWTASKLASEIEFMLSEANVPCSAAFSVADIAVDPQFQFREMLREIEDPHFGKTLQAGIVPHVPSNPGAIRWCGPRIGEHTEQILRDELGIETDRLQTLRSSGVLG